MAYIPPPRELPGFPKARRTDPKSQRQRWVDDEGHIFEWDYQHGAVEMYDPRGRHLGEFDYKTARQRKEPDPTRRIDT